MKLQWDRKDWLVLGGLLALALLAWSRVIFSRQWSFGIEGDFIRQFYPARYFAADSLASGTFPLWNPTLLCGQPFFASYQTAMLYPFNLVMVGAYGAAGAAFSLKAQCAFVVFHLFLAGVFTYLLAKDLGLSRTGGALAAITFMFSGYMVAHAGHINQVSAACWIPLVVMLFYRCLRTRKIWYALLAGAALGVALLAGHYQPLFYGCLLLFLLVLFSAVMRWRGEARRAGLLYGLGALLATVVVGAALAAVQLIPTYQLIGLSTRSHTPYEVAITYSLPRKQLVTLLFPHFYGSSPANYVGQWGMWEMYGYAGIIGGALGVVALLRKRKATVVFLWVALVISLILALGPDGYVFTLLYKAGLFVNRMRDPARILVLFGLLSALLAGFGADHLLDAYRKSANGVGYRSCRRLVTVLLVLTVALAVAAAVYLGVKGPAGGFGNAFRFRSLVMPTVMLALLLALIMFMPVSRMKSSFMSLCLVVLLAVDLLVMNVPWVMTRIDPNDPFEDRVASEYIAEQPGVFRVETDARTMYGSLDNGAVYGLEKTAGDDSLVLEDYFVYRNLVSPTVAPGVQFELFYSEGVRSPLLDAMNAVYFTSREKLAPQLYRGKFLYLGTRGGVHVYENLTPLPRAWMADAVMVADEEEALENLERTGGSLVHQRATVVIGPGDGHRAGELIEAIRGGVRVVEQSPQHLGLATDTECKGLLAVSEVMYPGWEVYVDGEKRDISRTNYLFRGVFLPGGQRKVDFYFRPRNILAGAVISASVAGLLVIFFILLLLKKRLERRRGAVDQAFGIDAGSQ